VGSICAENRFRAFTSELRTSAIVSFFTDTISLPTERREKGNAEEGAYSSKRMSVADYIHSVAIGNAEGWPLPRGKSNERNKPKKEQVDN
jgi:hypothetical protein